MTDVNDLHYTDGVHDVLAVYVNRLMDSTLRSEYKNIEILSADRELADADTPIQRFDCGGTNRIVTMPTADAVENHPFMIVNASDGGETLTVKSNDGTVTHKVLAAGASAFMLPDGVGLYVYISTGAPAGISLADVYPVGVVITLGVSTNPATLFGFGTWASIAGKVIVGINAGDAEFDTLNETGGAKTHALVAGEMPAHTHDTLTRSSYTLGATSQTRLINAETTGGATGTHTGGSAGTGGAHNNLQPYIVKYVWERTG